MRPLDVRDDRREPVMGTLSTFEEHLGNRRTSERGKLLAYDVEQRNEPSWNAEAPVLLDAIDADTSSELVAKGKRRATYRVVDWLSAVAILLISVAFFVAVKQSLL